MSALSAALYGGVSPGARGRVAGVSWAVLGRTGLSRALGLPRAASGSRAGSGPSLCPEEFRAPSQTRLLPGSRVSPNSPPCPSAVSPLFAPARGRPVVAGGVSGSEWLRAPGQVWGMLWSQREARRGWWGLSRPQVCTARSLHLPVPSWCSNLGCSPADLATPGLRAAAEGGGRGGRMPPRAGLSAAVAGGCCCALYGALRCSGRMKRCRGGRGVRRGSSGPGADPPLLWGFMQCSSAPSPSLRGPSATPLPCSGLSAAGLFPGRRSGPVRGSRGCRGECSPPSEPAAVQFTCGLCWRRTGCRKVQR